MSPTALPFSTPDAPSGCRRDFLVAFGGARLASTAARLGRLFLAIFGGADCRRQHAQSDTLFGFAVFLASALISRRKITTELRSLSTLEPIAPAFAARTAGFGFAVLVDRFGLDVQILVALNLFVLTIAAATLGLLFLKAGAILFKHTEIMVRVLKIIFGLDPIARELRVARQRLIFFKKLSGVAALAVVLPSTGIAGHALRALSTAAATAAALTIVDQLVVSLSHWRRHYRSPQFFLP